MQPMLPMVFDGHCFDQQISAVIEQVMKKRHPQSEFPPKIPSRKLTLHLKIDGWKATFLLGRPVFRGYVGTQKSKCWTILESYLSPFPNNAIGMSVLGRQVLLSVLIH